MTKDVFYDIELVKWPSVQVYDTETYNLLNKYNKILGRSQWLSNYACYKKVSTAGGQKKPGEVTYEIVFDDNK